MLGRKPYSGESREEPGETRRKGLGAARPTANHPTGSALPGFFRRRSGQRAQHQQHQNGSENLPGMETRPGALRVALEGREDRPRRSSDTSARIDDANQQQRRRAGSRDESTRRSSMSATTTTTAATKTVPSLELREPAQPRDSSPTARPLSVRQRQGGLNVFSPRGGYGGSGRRSSNNSHVSHAAHSFESRAFAGENSAAVGRTMGGSVSAPAPGYRGGTANGGGSSGRREGAWAGGRGGEGYERSPLRTGARGMSGSDENSGGFIGTTGAERSRSRRSSGSAIAGNRSSTVSNQAEDIMSTISSPQRLSAPSTSSASYHSGSPYLQAGFQRAAGGPRRHNSSRSGRINQNDDAEDNSNDDTAHHHRSSGGRAGSEGGRREGYCQPESGRSSGSGTGGGGACNRASLSTAPSNTAATELYSHLPSIDGLDIGNKLSRDCSEGGGKGEEMAGSRREGEGCVATSSPLMSSGSMRHRRGRDSSESGDGLNSSREMERCRTGETDSDDRGEHGRGGVGEGKEHGCAGAAEASAVTQPNRTAFVSGGGMASGVSSEGGSDMGLFASRKSSYNSAGGSLQPSADVPGRKGSGDNASASSKRGTAHKREWLVGLQNLGNTCFMNACLQCLLHTDDLVDLFISGRVHHEQRSISHNNKSPTHGALARAFGELVALVQASPAHSLVSPAQVKRLIGKYAPHLSGYGQQDCQEFLRFFLDGLAEDLNTRGGKGGDSGSEGREGGRGPHQPQQQCSAPPAPPVEQNLSDEQFSKLTAEQQADRAWALHLTRNDSKITSMFCGQLQSRISCLSCGNISFCFDPFFDLSVPLPSTTSGSRVAGAGGRGGFEDGGFGGKYSRGAGGRESRSASAGTRTTTAAATVSLEDCLRAFSTEETLDGDNRPVCARCRRRRTSAKRLAVHRFPPVLVIHLKRFQYNSTSRTKLSTVVEFPIGSGLDLGPFSTPAARLSSSGSGGDGSDDDHRRRESSIPDRSFRDSACSNNGRHPSPPLYELYAVCNHMGSLQGGHYTAHCRSRSSVGSGRGCGGGASDDGIEPEWHTFDDSRVGPVNVSHVGGASAYVLFYRLLKKPER